MMECRVQNAECRIQNSNSAFCILHSVLPVLHHPPVAQRDDAVSHGSVLLRVRDLHDGRALAFSFLKSRMISRPWSEWRLPVGSSARRQLGLARSPRARRRPAAAVRPRAGSGRGPSCRRSGSGRACRRRSRRARALRTFAVRQRHVEVLGDRQVVEQVVLLEDEADVLLVELERCLAFSACTSWPRKRYSPAQSSSSMPRIASSVDLPAPDGPMMVTNSPAAIERDPAQQEDPASG